MTEPAIVPDEIIAPDTARERREAFREEARQLGLVVIKPKQGYTQWSELIEEALLDSFCRGSSVRAACAEASVSTNTFYEHFRLPGGFRERVQQARESLIGVVEESLVRSCVEPDKHGRRDIQSIKFFLTNRAADRYAERVDHLHRSGDLEVSENTTASRREFTPQGRKQAKLLAKELILGAGGETETELEAAEAAKAEDEELPY
jgi:hypothetical protein